MLKVKDDLDLKELEKYGFELDTTFKDYPEYKLSYMNSREIIFSKILLKEQKDICEINIDVNTRIIRLHINTHLANIPNTLYDLIKDGLVEKVKD